MVTSKGEGACMISEPTRMLDSRPRTYAVANGIADNALVVLIRVQMVSYGIDLVFLKKH
jgi:hypothetical protein